VSFIENIPGGSRRSLSAAWKDKIQLGPVFDTMTEEREKELGMDKEYINQTIHS
jgi:hypothetical protein